LNESIFKLVLTKIQVPVEFELDKSDNVKIQTKN